MIKPIINLNDYTDEQLKEGRVIFAKQDSLGIAENNLIMYEVITHEGVQAINKLIEAKVESDELEEYGVLLLLDKPFIEYSKKEIRNDLTEMTNEIKAVISEE